MRLFQLKPARAWTGAWTGREGEGEGPDGLLVAVFNILHTYLTARPKTQPRAFSVSTMYRSGPLGNVRGRETRSRTPSLSLQNRKADQVLGNSILTPFEPGSSESNDRCTPSQCSCWTPALLAFYQDQKMWAKKSEDKDYLLLQGKA